MKEWACQANNEVVVDYRNRINQAVAFIEANLFRPVTLDEVAAAANFSPFHFHRIFAAFTGETVFEYLLRTRMKKAVALLMSGQPSHAIAVETGYQTTSAFTKAFKRTFACSPTAYKRRSPVDKDRGGLDSGECRFEACFSCKKDPSFSPNTDVDEKTIDAGKWAVFRHHGAYNSLWQTWNWIYRYWCPSSGIECRDADPFELI